MNKTELINAMAEKTGMTKVAAKAAMNACFASIQEQLNKGQKVSLIGFGTFSVVERKARTAKNPQTGEKVKVPAKKVAKFKAGSSLLAKKGAKKAAKKK
ncbi:MAG: HU family DNA-binding protein [Bacteroidales bacterium]|jgi:DNA-binding protein HU-beta|nr:HU family DNA-binding protein [Bacteroidales bacterium]